MKTKAWLAFPTLLALELAAGRLGAADTAVVTKQSVNVRGQPSLAGEVIIQLKKGETVTVLEEITARNPKPDEPAKWFRIAMPAGTPVWVYASFIDSTNKTVIPRRLNLRAGPGENFSIVGRIEKGTSVKEISAHGDWLEIETPADAYAFVARELLELKPSEPPASPAPATPPTAEPPAASPSPLATPAQEEKPAAKPQTESAPAPAPSPPPAAEPSPKAETTAAPAETTPEAQPPPPPRIVRREGIISGTVSIQAPTYYQLNNVDSGKVLDYLHAASININLKKLNGKRVIVTGEEAIDPRWPRTPVLEIETLDTAP